MSQGYDAYFKKVRSVRRGEPEPQVVGAKKSSHPRSAPVQKPKALVPRRRAQFPFGALAFLAGISALLGWWSVDPELPNRILKKIDFQMMGAASAASDTKAEKSAATNAKTEAKSASDQPGDGGPQAQTPNTAVPEDTSYIDKLRARKQALDLREKELNELEEELHKQKAEIEARIKQLEGLRTQITSVLKERVELDQERVMKLVETYSNMKPKQAAEVLAGMDEDLAVEVLGKMKKKNAAEIMNLLEPAKARSISEKYAGYKTR